MRIPGFEPGLLAWEANIITTRSYPHVKNELNIILICSIISIKLFIKSCLLFIEFSILLLFDMTILINMVKNFISIHEEYHRFFA